jgi:hypothetical protein
MPLFKTGDLLNGPGIKIVTACSYLTVDHTLYMGKGLARELKVMVPGIDEIFGRMLLDNGGHLGRYGVLIYEKYGVFQVRRHYDERADLDLIIFGKNKLKSFAKETGYLIHLEFPGQMGELNKEEVKAILDDLPYNVYVWERYGGQNGLHA